MLINEGLSLNSNSNYKQRQSLLSKNKSNKVIDNVNVPNQICAFNENNANESQEFIELYKNRNNINEIEKKNSLESYLKNSKAEVTPVLKKGKAHDREKFRNLRVAKKIYHSLSEDEDNFMLNKFSIDPNSKFKFFIDFSVFVVCFFYLFIVPLRIIFFENTKLSIILIELLLDLIFLFDMIGGFFTAFYDFEENFITKIKQTSFNYLTRFFFLDLISAIPFNSIIELHNYFYINDYDSNNLLFKKEHFSGEILYNFYKQKENANNFLLTKTNISTISFYDLLNSNFRESYRLLKIFRLAKFPKIFANNKFYNWISEELISENFIKPPFSKIVFYYFIFFNITHILNCIFIFLGTIDYPSWIISAGLNNKEFHILYINAMYFNLTTIFSVGYGDITAKNLYEKYYNVFLMMIGVMMYSFALSSVSHIIHLHNKKKKNYEEKKTYLENLNFKYNIDFTNSSLYSKISKHLTHEYNYDKVNKNQLLFELPIILRNQIIMNMYADIINSFNFFKDCNGDVDFITQAILILKPTISTKADILIKQGDFVEEIIFVKRGILQLETILLSKKDDIKILQTIKTNFLMEKNFKLKDEKNKVIFQRIRLLKLRKNEHFGDAIMIDNVRSPLTVKTSSQIAEIYLMDKLNVSRLSNDFSDIFENIYLKSSINMARIA